MSENILSEAQSACNELITALEIKKVICIEDEGGVTTDDLVILQQELTDEQLKIIMPEIGEKVPVDVEIRNATFRKAIDGIDKLRKNEVITKIFDTTDQKDGTNQNDQHSLHILKELINENILEVITFDEWGKRSDELIAASKTNKILFLFDQDLSKGGGKPEEGISLIASLLSSEDTNSFLCGLLTHTVKPDEQYEKWETLSKAHGIERDRFLVVPKLYLQENPSVFARMLKLIALSPLFTKLKKCVSEIVKNSTDDALSKMDQISIDDFEHIVFHIPEKEGLWEPDMLFRLFSLYHRQKSMILANGTDDLETISKELRSLSRIPVLGKNESAGLSWNIQKDELYDLGEHINKYHLPIELGDIFEKTGSDSVKKYILLMQPCDLIIRSNGKRSPEPEIFILAEIEKYKESPYQERLPYFGDRTDGEYGVNFKRLHYIKPYVIDLCAFNEDGLSKINLEKECKDTIRPQWINRYKYIVDEMRKKIGKIDSCKINDDDSADIKQIKSKLKKEVFPLILNEGIFKCNVDVSDGNFIIKYNCRRLKRYSRQRSTSLLMSLSSCMSRPGFDVDFGIAREECKQ
ncbi:MAG TPA: hypothetical protein PKM65_20075 [Spirochaetota bacterium]|nr:hypothetical protein [Spirochaetota bacterium]HNT13129.1 hypothetical protein [Spirochaetota bacterium]